MSDKYTLVHEGLSRWINSPNNGGECCQTFADTVDELNRLLARIQRLEEFARTIENDFDHDEDAHRYGTTCRVCDAKDLLKETKAKEAKP